VPHHLLSIDIAASREKVWREITKTGSVQRPLFNTGLESQLVPGARLRYYCTNRKRGFVVGEVVEVMPPSKFVHTYIFTQYGGPPTPVTWELEETPGGCRVTLTDSGWTEEHKHYQSSGSGWRRILELLKADGRDRRHSAQDQGVVRGHERPDDYGAQRNQAQRSGTLRLVTPLQRWRCSLAAIHRQMALTRPVRSRISSAS
jgi:uncharacterized protein YndB with AHSA1/START domain